MFWTDMGWLIKEDCMINFQIVTFFLNTLSEWEAVLPSMCSGGIHGGKQQQHGQQNIPFNNSFLLEHGPLG